MFLSYRRADSGGHAGRLFDHLSWRFRDDLVFLDVEDLAPGDDWTVKLLQEIAECDAFLAVIGSSWLDLRDEQGRRRIDVEEDILRGEICLALEKDRVVIPVVVGDATVPSEDDLPDAIKPLVARQAVALRDDRWKDDVAVLLDRLSELLAQSRPDMDLDSTRAELRRLQDEYFKTLESRKDAGEALDLAAQALRILDSILPLYPHDPELKVTRGYIYKNESMALRQLGRHEEADRALEEADRVFRTMSVEDPEDPSALNGRGSVAALRHDFESALEFIDQALEIDPSYEAARRDRDMILSRAPRRTDATGGENQPMADHELVKAGLERVREQMDDGSEIVSECTTHIRIDGDEANAVELAGRWRQWILFTERLIQRVLPASPLAERFAAGFESRYAAATENKSVAAVVEDIHERLAVLEEVEFELELLG